MKNIHNHFMSLAIEEAKKAKFPFWCVIIKNGEVVSSWRSWESIEHDPTAHAEINAIRSACKKLETKNLEWCILYCTCEPCPMCFTACYRAGIRHIIFWITLEISDRLFHWELLLPCKTINLVTWNIITLEWWYMEEEIIELYHKNS
jgi:guanine deaminase